MAAQLPTFDELLKETAESFQSLYSMMPVIGACAPGRAEYKSSFLTILCFPSHFQVG